MIRTSHVRALLAILIPMAVSAEEPFNPHKIPGDQFARQVHVVALRPVWLPWDTVNADGVAARFETIIGETLRAKGYTIIASSEYARLRRQISERAGGSYDPMTGAADAKKFEVITSHTARELERLHQADAVLFVWVGLEDVLSGPNFWTGQMYLWGDPVTFHGQGVFVMPQRLIASRAALRIDDINGVELYGGRVGLEWQKIYVARSFYSKPADQQYSDTQVRDSLGILLDPMVRRVDN